MSDPGSHAGRSDWDREFPGVDAWRKKFEGDERAIRQWEEDILDQMHKAFGRHGGLEQHELERAFLYGSFPATEVVAIFRSGLRPRGCRLGYSNHAWMHPDMTQILVVNCEEHVNSFLSGPDSASLRAFGCDHGEVIWISNPPGAYYRGPRLDS